MTSAREGEGVRDRLHLYVRRLARGEPQLQEPDRSRADRPQEVVRRGRGVGAATSCRGGAARIGAGGEEGGRPVGPAHAGALSAAGVVTL